MTDRPLAEDAKGHDLALFPNALDELLEGLFTNGAGERADRLVLTRDSDGADLGGWSRGPIRDRIEEHLGPFATQAKGPPPEGVDADALAERVIAARTGNLFDMKGELARCAREIRALGAERDLFRREVLAFVAEVPKSDRELEEAAGG